MAQHYSLFTDTQNLPRALAKVKQSILKDFQRPIYTINSSLKYEKLNEIYKEAATEQVYGTQRYIGKGIVCNDTHGYFEIHFEPDTRVVNQIYLVA